MENDNEKPSRDNENARQLVEQGYDKMAATYLDWTTSKKTPRVACLDKMLSKMSAPSSANVLELGCGAGVPVTQLLSSRCAKVIGNDISKAQIELAKSRIKETNVEFIQGDMTKLEFEHASFDGVAAFYSIIHLPRDEQSTMFQNIFSWMKPGGYLLCNLGATDLPGHTAKDWLGSQMYWSSYDVEGNLKLVRDAGFTIDEHEILEDDEDGLLVPFLWILAVKKN
ncbi:Demethylrebeccamycin-D-glucose O-methyltransferase [Lachnellula suecica]|uniref:Demethylrebeccamycin-D-glucose O-methyltransferase n=1 Tax=Lachnellula suecica TaxID=602035 RepID=A0A8T9CHV5_9HELO|nr:Demethylrebeccamycin-D-glucose O-methyltransferase [Lachnellula suecica]